MDEIIDALRFINSHGLYPDIKTITSCPTSSEVTIDGREVLLFCSNDYLGLANSPIVKKAAHEAVEKYGVGSGGSRLVSGNTDIQEKLEKAIAEFKGGESAIVFSTGYMANTGTIQAVTNVINIRESENGIVTSPFANRSCNIFVDELSHASIIDGCRLSRAKTVAYKHRDMADLETKLGKYPDSRKLIVTDGVFSMDGDIAPLPEIVKLAKKYGALIMIDDAHASGVLGEGGRGTIEYFGLKPDDVDILMGTFTKSFGGVGGFIVGNKQLVDFLRINSRPYLFSAPIPPVISASLIAAIEEARDNNGRRTALWKNANYLRKNLQQMGFDTLSSETQIIPILIGDEKKCMAFSQSLFESGLLAPCIRWPAVPWGQSRIRIIVRAIHAKEQIDYFLETTKRIAVDLGVLDSK